MELNVSKTTPYKTIERNGYRVEIYSPKCAIVTDKTGERLTKPVTVTELLKTGDSNPKLAKNGKLAVTFGLSLAPYKKSGIGNVCAFAKTCIKPCLNEQGRGGSETVSNARIARTVLFYLARQWFFAKLTTELEKIERKHKGETIGVRLNMFSDIPYEHHGIIDQFPAIQFWDYTKNPRRAGWIRPNYYVTFSYDGTNKTDAIDILHRGGCVSVVFYENSDGPKCGRSAHKQTLPSEWHGFPVIDGGLTDWRPSDPPGSVVGLRLLAKTYENRQTGIDSGFAQLVVNGVSV